jgi:anti-sigma28 factor (negative regulator of flagellin synthesis)
MEFNRINRVNNNAISAYKSIKKTAVSDSGGANKPSGSFDTVEINFAQSLQSAKANIASRLAAEANIARIKELQEEYSGDEVPVSVTEIAQAILGD